MRRLSIILGLIALVLAPMALGTYFVSVPETGRNSRSTVRVGHKAFFELLGDLGWTVRRFERGIEAPPEGPAVLIALEPGPALFRGGGVYARPLLEWIEEGNAALVTLGRDPDHDAEADDRGQLFGGAARRALDLAREAEASIGEPETATAASMGSAGKSGADQAEGPDTEQLTTSPLDPSESWEGEVLMRFLDIAILDARAVDLSHTRAVPLEGPWAGDLGPAPALVLTRPRTFQKVDRPAARTPRVLVSAAGAPILLELEIGRGRLLLLSEPRLLQNGAIGRAAHARIGVRAVEHLARAAGGTRRVFFEEWSHGGREVDNILDLALHSRARWPLFQVLAVALTWILAVAGRRRSIVPSERPPRRSRHEVIEAMASLFLRSGDVEGAHRRLVALTRLRLARALGAFGPSPEGLARTVAERTRRPLEEVRACLRATPVSSQKQLMDQAEKLRELRASVDVRR